MKITCLHVLFVAALATLLGAGCGPYMGNHTTTIDGYRPEVTCGQGPFEIELAATGNRWGEGVEVVAYAPKPIVGRARIVVEGEEGPSQGSTFGPRRTIGRCCDRDGRWTTEVEDVSEPDNARCLADAGAISTAIGSGPSAPGTVVEMGTPAGSGVGTPEPASSDAPPVALPRLERVEWSGAFHLDGEALQTRGVGELDVVRRTWGTVGDDYRAELRAGARILVQIWSEAPNDLEGVTFVVHHYDLRPSTSDEEWIAHLEEERRNREREFAEQQAEAERRSAEWRAHCDAHHEDTECWGPGGYEGAVARQRAAERRPPAAQWTPPPETSPPPARVEPGVPPPPHEDPRPPKQSEHATWVPGYWHWAEVRWVWVGGFWRVPESDIQAGLTARAPTAPPAPQAETPPPAPAAGMVWAAGYWMWDGAEWVWVSGAWRVAQQGTTRWEPPRWEVRVGGGFVLTPGGFR
jgi:hypothetical protein